VTTLETWAEAACAELGLPPDQVRVRLVLDLARDVAHAVERPAAPLTAFLLGLAVGSGQSPEEAARRLTDLASRWPKPAVEPGERRGSTPASS
jgi:hypothetical protein